MNDYLDERARRAKNKQEIFNNQVKVVLFLIAVGTGVATIWDKCGSMTHNPVAVDSSRQRVGDSAGAGSAHRVASTSSGRRHHPKIETNRAGEEGKEKKDGSSGGGSPSERETNLPTKAGPSGAAVAAKVLQPVQVVTAEDIEFKLLSAVGNSRMQTITMTVVLTNSAANRFIWSAVESISDADGNEYLLKSFTNGASPYDNHIPLDTEAPRKCTYTFGGILPSVKMIRLFKFRYRHKSLDDPNTVEFRDIPIDWK